MKKKNIFFVLLICFINSSCNKEEQTYVEEELGQLMQEMPNEITISPAAKRQYRRAVDLLKSLLCEVR